MIFHKISCNTALKCVLTQLEISIVIVISQYGNMYNIKQTVVTSTAATQAWYLTTIHMTSKQNAAKPLAHHNFLNIIRIE